MALNLKQTLQQKQLLKLSPRQVQLMKLMQVPTLDLERRVKEELQENPALEEGEGGIYADEVPLSQLKEDSEETHANDDDSASDARTDEGTDKDFDVRDYVDADRDDYAYKRKSDNYRDPDDEYRAPVRFRQSFREQLNDELGMLALSEQQRRIGEVIVGNLDEDGYLQRSVPAMVNDMAFSLNIMATESEVEEVLRQIQGLDPAGIGARDLRECLLLQVRRKLGSAARPGGNGLSPDEIRVWRTAEKLLEKCFDEFAARQYTRVMEKMKMSEEEVKEAVAAIRTLNPKPGQGGPDTAAQEVPTLIPDFYLSNDDGVLSLRLHGKNDPNLRLSPAYESMLQAYGAAGEGMQAEKKRQTREAALFVKQKIDSARWFMDMVKQRQTTLLRVMQAVVDFQHDFFLKGDVKYLRPMRLKDIAEKVDLDISTVSRVLNNKFIQTHFGTFPIKKIFSQSLENEEGEEISTAQIKAVLSELIENEDKTNPLSDEALGDALKEEGFVVARRTVAKYRESLGYDVARLRRQI